MTRVDQEAKALEIAKAYARRAGYRYAGMLDVEAIEGAAYLGAAKALASFDPARGTKFSTHAIWKVRSEILEEARHQDPLPRSIRHRLRREVAEGGELPAWAERAVSLEEQGVWVEGEWFLTILPVHAPWEEAPIEERDATAEAARFVLDRAELCHWLNHLPHPQGALLEWRYWEGLTFPQIGQRLGVSASQCHQMHAEALTFLREVVPSDLFAAGEKF